MTQDDVIALVIGLSTFVVAGATLWVAVLTLKRIDEQISLAREELGVVKADVARNEIAFNKTNRESELWLAGGFDSRNRGPGLPTLTVELALVNTGEIVDLSRLVVIGFHNSLSLDDRGTEWEVFELTSFGAYRDFSFVKLNSTFPIYCETLIRLPPIYLFGDSLTVEKIVEYVAIGQVSSIYNQKPFGNGRYGYLTFGTDNIEYAKIADVHAPYDGVPYGPSGSNTENVGVAPKTADEPA